MSDDETQREMPRYRCHKEVHALKIKEVRDASRPGCESDGSVILYFDEPGYSGMRMLPEWAEKHQPRAGGYLVVYEDGYQSWSPAEAFESGYTRIS